MDELRNEKLRNEELERENARLRLLLEGHEGDYWAWQGDGFDYPESLTCPVIMSANTLRELLKKANLL